MTAAPAAAVETVTLDVVLELELARLRLLLDGRHAPELDSADERRTAALAALADAGRPAPSERLSALFGLTGFERDVLLLCFVEGHDPVETARLLGKTETAVQNLRRRGLESLRRELSKRHEADFFEATA